VRSPVEEQLFAFHRGRPEDLLTAYALERWGSGGTKTFSDPAFVSSADVADGPAPERLLEIGRYAVVDVPEIGGFYCRDLGERGVVSNVEARDATGGAKPDVVLRYSIRDRGEKEDWERWRAGTRGLAEVTSVSHDIVEVWSFARATPARWFVHEVAAWASCCGSETNAPPHVSNDMTIARGVVTLRFRDAWRVSRSTWHEQPVEGVPPALLPWDAVKERSFRFDGKSFVPLAPDAGAGGR
jgi:hypothetical protein